MLLDIVPDRVFIPRLKRCNEVNDPILLGIVPVNDKPANTIDVTLAYVADPLTVPHVTPLYEHHGGKPADKLRSTVSTSSDVLIARWMCY